MFSKYLACLLDTWILVKMLEPTELQKNGLTDLNKFGDSIYKLSPNLFKPWIDIDYFLCRKL